MHVTLWKNTQRSVNTNTVYLIRSKEDALVCVGFCIEYHNQSFIVKMNYCLRSVGYTEHQLVVYHYHKPITYVDT